MGYAFLSAYVLLVGVGTFFQKSAMKQLSPFQLEVLMALGMFVVSIPALFIAQKNLAIPISGIPAGGLVGILFALGSLMFTLSLSKLNAGYASALSISYVAVVTVLSVLILRETISFTKIAGIVLTLAGVGLLYLEHR